MPNIDGIKAAEQVRHTARNRRTPILFLSAYDLSPDELARAQRQRPIDLLHRPCEAALLLSRITQLLGHSAVQRPSKS